MIKIAFVDDCNIVVTSQSHWNMTTFVSGRGIVLEMDDHPLRKSATIISLRGTTSCKDFSPIKADASVVDAIGEHLDFPNSKVVMSSWDYTGREGYNNICKK